MKKNYKLFWLLPCAFIPLLGVNAQDDADDQDVIDLSPFVVTGDGDIGYMATSTLAGTRLKTDLRDIGASITILNKEFLDDTASTDLADVLLLTPNTEISGPNGNFSGVQGFGGGNPIPEGESDRQSGGRSRIRGLAPADLTRNYFLTDVPFDTYNVDRIAVQRGANSALFGIGSPGGIVNHNTIRADMLGNRGRVRLETDEFGTARASLRYNYEVIDDTLSVLVAGLYSDTRYGQQEAFAEDERIFVSATYKLNQNIRAHASVEAGSRHSANPDPIPANDGISTWYQMGKPVVENPIEGANLFRGAGTFAPGINNNLFVTLAAPGTSSGFAAFYTDPSNPNATFGGNTFVRRNRGAPDDSVTGELMMVMPRNTSFIANRTGLYPDGTPIPTGTQGFFNGGFLGKQLLDRSIFDYREHMFQGAAYQQAANFELYNLSLEGTWWDGKVGAEVAYYEQKWFGKSSNPLQGADARTIYIDPNKYLIATTNGQPDGPWIPNPTFGQPVMGSFWQGNHLSADRDSLRATAFFELAADDVLEESLLTKIFGRFRGTGVYQERTLRDSESYGRFKIDADAVNAAIEGDTGLSFATMRTGGLYALPYSGNVDFLNATSINDVKGANISGNPFGKQRSRPPTDQTWTSWSQSANGYVNFDATTYTLDDNGNYPASFFAGKGLEELESKVLVGQWYLWQDSIVLMGSWRNDKQRSTSISAPGGSGDYGGDGDEVLDPTFVAGPQAKDLELDADEDTTSWSITVHTPPELKEMLPNGMDLSVYMSEASNFQPSAGRVNIYNEQIAPISGETEERGIIFSMMDNKLVVRYNHYTTSTVNNSYDVGGVSASEGILRGLVEQLALQQNIDQGFTAADSQAVLPPQGVLDVNGFQPNWNDATVVMGRNSNDNGTQDYVSKGNEVEIAYNPTPRWTMMIGLSEQETTLSNTYPVLQQYVNDFVIPNWVNSSFAQNFFIDDLATTTLAEKATTSIVNPVQQALTQDGLTTIEQRKYRVNFNTAYNFGPNSDSIPGWLGEFTVGGGLRWEDKLGIGFGVSENSLGNYALDPEKPFFASDQLFVDVFFRSRYHMSDGNAWTVQLNIKDLTNNNQLVPIYANPDGSKLYRFLEGRVISMSATFEF